MSQLASDSIFWVEVDKIKPNPYQPRREFNEVELRALSDSIRQYGVLQPLVVTRREVHKPDGGIVVEYELIAGERRLRASKLAGVATVPVVIRTGEDDNLMKLELAIIENLQREDLNPVDRAKAFQQFVDEFGYKHVQIAKKVGKSREYVSNSLRLLSLPDEILDALVDGRITEGHARPIMMLRDKPEEQMTLFKEIVHKKLTVRDAESIARRSAQDKIRKKSRDFNPEILKLEKELTEQLGTRVHIETREVGGKITIDFFSDEDLRNLLALMNTAEKDGEEQDEVQKETQQYKEVIQPPQVIQQSEQQKTPEQPVSVTPPAPPIQQPQMPSMQHTQQHDIGSMVGHQYRTEPVKTVAFGGGEKEEVSRASLGDVLKDVLAKEQVKKETLGDIQTFAEQSTYRERVEKTPPFSEPAEVTDAQPRNSFSDIVAKKEDEVPDNVEDDDLFLPDMSSFRSEVDELLGGSRDRDMQSIASQDDTTDDPFSVQLYGMNERVDTAFDDTDVRFKNS
jgi:ParB family chromosome partitioning protein